MGKVQAKKHLGQNFLTDELVIEQIIFASQVKTGDHVLEIGPGTGMLTKALAATGARVTAIEFDHDLIEHLNQRFIESDNVSILEGNILDIHLAELLENLGYEHRQYKIVANIPYYITAPIIRALLSLRSQPESMTLMVQDEVADRLCARPGSMSLLSIMAQYYATVEKKFFVKKECFDPIPKVDSAVIQVAPKRGYDPDEDRKIFRVARAGFSARRKTLANNLANSFHLPRTEIEPIIAHLGLLLTVRAQGLSVEQWIRLSELLKGR
jgi:16S rRNA (adenine1518-N6/adenine1519-N6)-dimethyltransferase